MDGTITTAGVTAVTTESNEPKTAAFTITRNGTSLSFFLEKTVKGATPGRIVYEPESIDESNISRVRTWVGRENEDNILFKTIRGFSMKAQDAATPNGGAFIPDEWIRHVTEFSIESRTKSELVAEHKKLTMELVALTGKIAELGIEGFQTAAKVITDKITALNLAIDKKTRGGGEDEEDDKVGDATVAEVVEKPVTT